MASSEHSILAMETDLVNPETPEKHVIDFPEGISEEGEERFVKIIDMLDSNLDLQLHLHLHSYIHI